MYFRFLTSLILEIYILLFLIKKKPPTLYITFIVKENLVTLIEYTCRTRFFKYNATYNLSIQFTMNILVLKSLTLKMKVVLSADIRINFVLCFGYNVEFIRAKSR